MKRTTLAVFLALGTAFVYAQNAAPSDPAETQTPLAAALDELGAPNTTEGRRMELLDQMHPVPEGWSVEVRSYNAARSEFELTLKTSGAEYSAVASGPADATGAIEADLPGKVRTLTAKVSESRGAYPVEYYRLKVRGVDGSVFLEAEFLRPDGAWIQLIPIFRSMRERMDSFAQALDSLKDAEEAAVVVGSYMDDMGAFYASYEAIADRFASDNLGVPPLAAQQAANDIDQANFRMAARTGKLKAFVEDQRVKDAVLRARDLPFQFSGKILEQTGLEASQTVQVDPNKDYTGLVSLFQEFVTVSQNFVQAADSVADAKAAATAIRAFAEGLGPLYDRMRNVVGDNPELATMSEPPLPLQPVFQRMSEIGPQVQAALDKLRPFSENDEVKDALQKLFALGGT